MSFKKKGALVITGALIFLALCAGRGSDGLSQETINRQRWENAVDEYVRVVNSKNFGPVDLLTYYKDSNGDLKVKVESYNW